MGLIKTTYFYYHFFRILCHNSAHNYILPFGGWETAVPYLSKPSRGMRRYILEINFTKLKSRVMR